MKPIHVVLMMLNLLTACVQSENNSQKLQSQLDSLQQQINQAYRPGFGEFMSSIQIHHEKLWFAGLNGNWKLADFEINEIREALQNLQTYCKDRPERQSLPMIMGPLDGVSVAIKARNSVAFKSGFITLTNTCNTCHLKTSHEFNVIRIPETPPFSNQVFKPNEKQ